MKHYDSQTWKLYHTDSLPGDKRDEMEKHLYSCDECLSTYLSVIETSERNSISIPSTAGFTERVMGLVKTERPYSEHNQALDNRINLLVYYAAAACITLLLMFSGAFRFVSDSAYGTTEQIIKSSESIGSIFTSGWSERLTNKASIVMDKIKPKDN